MTAGDDGGCGTVACGGGRCGATAVGDYCAIGSCGGAVSGRAGGGLNVLQVRIVLTEGRRAQFASHTEKLTLPGPRQRSSLRSHDSSRRSILAAKIMPGSKAPIGPLDRIDGTDRRNRTSRCLILAFIASVSNRPVMCWCWLLCRTCSSVRRSSSARQYCSITSRHRHLLPTVRYEAFML